MSESVALLPQLLKKPQPVGELARHLEITFRAQPDGATLVELEHRHLERHGAGGTLLRQAIDSEGGWGLLLQLYSGAVAKG